MFSNILLTRRFYIIEHFQMTFYKCFVFSGNEPKDDKLASMNHKHESKHDKLALTNGKHKSKNDELASTNDKHKPNEESLQQRVVNINQRTHKTR